MFNPIVWYLVFGTFAFISYATLDSKLWKHLNAYPLDLLLFTALLFTLWPIVILIRLHSEYVYLIEERYRKRIMANKTAFHQKYEKHEREFQWKK